MLRALNPEYRHDIVPGTTKPSAIRMPLADTGRFIDNADSIYAYHADELFNKRMEVSINDDVPTYTRRTGKAAARWPRSRRKSNARHAEAAKEAAAVLQ